MGWDLDSHPNQPNYQSLIINYQLLKEGFYG
jgi:hypothetical protein